MNERLISFDLKSDFGFFKNPGHNEGLLQTYNILHKPALLGILGAIAGLNGYQRKGELPEYYLKYKNIPVGIQPLNHKNGLFGKTSVKYTNTVGYANEDGTLLIEESMLVSPAFRCYLLLDLDNQIEATLYERLVNESATFIPYMGKNEYQAWITNVITDYRHEPMFSRDTFSIASIFIQSDKIQAHQAESILPFIFSDNNAQRSFCLFEVLPAGFDEHLTQYSYNNFVFTNWRLESSELPPDLYQAITSDNEEIILQLF
ncbi:type I-B CRISPR-associated protein Cas5b [Chitinophaga qingshengii]|uniref:Type I-B CRISPR-associated protein Cas5 n=1 Tax=Chitinophaga qingshengii TaxID=1569794 RepID=A0ABR7TIR2_9BACT|nr:type I-B CRISPR-associated protein Cas5b [Chitinophaga qingshengii]MBC9929880.1 type I-B CRISPR-associated protein Cas5 [Chitinophaga qingshengii]